jgi:hypothetical protein
VSFDFSQGEIFIAPAVHGAVNLFLAVMEQGYAHENFTDNKKKVGCFRAVLVAFGGAACSFPYPGSHNFSSSIEQAHDLEFGTHNDDFRCIFYGWRGTMRSG